MIERRVEIRPPWAFRLPRAIGMDGVLRRRGGVLMRLLHVDGQPAVVRAAQPAASRVVMGARAERADVAEEALVRMRFALGVDEDLRRFHQRFRHDPVIGPVVRAQPWLRPLRRPEPFEALAWAICEQLIDYPRAAAIQRRIVWRLGRRCPRTGLRDLPTAATLAAQAPARLRSWDLAEVRCHALLRAAREVASGRVDLHAPRQEDGWRRLRAIPGIGAWTVEMLAVHGQGRHDQVPAGDLNLLKLVGRLRTGDPEAVASEPEVRAFFASYAPWAGLAWVYALRARAAQTPWPGRNSLVKAPSTTDGSDTRSLRAIHAA